jgi:hypothetical protein
MDSSLWSLEISPFTPHVTTGHGEHLQDGSHRRRVQLGPVVRASDSSSSAPVVRASDRSNSARGAPPRSVPAWPGSARVRQLVSVRRTPSWRWADVIPLIPDGVFLPWEGGVRFEALAPPTMRYTLPRDLQTPQRGSPATLYCGDRAQGVKWLS